MKYDLSILIPARNEMFLARTIQDILENIRGKTEIIAVMDGYWTKPEIQDDPRVTIIHYTESIGQRAATNAAAKLSSAKYVAKVDAHCSFDEGFDIKLMKGMQDDWTVVPIMRNLWAFDWKCRKCGYKRYQGPTPVDCPKCDNTTKFRRKMMWVGKNNPQSTSYCFDTEPHFQYFKDYRKRKEYIDMLEATGFTETMSLQGSFFMMTRKKYWDLNICDEAAGSWGNQGLEVAIKTWLSGGKCIVNHNTWYAHMFRTQGGDFGFPYHQPGREVAKTKEKIKESVFNNKWEKAIYPLSWLIKKFWPIPGWTQEDLDKLEIK